MYKHRPLHLTLQIIKQLEKSYSRLEIIEISEKYYQLAGISTLGARLIYTLHKLRIMKKLISVVILIFAFSISGQCVRIITNFDIARWYLDADLVLICNVKQIDTLTISRYDSLFADGFNIRYNIVREKYQISIDSIIKGGELISGKMDTIFTPDFFANYSRTRTFGKEFIGLDSKGDSIFLMHIELFGNDCYDDSYFRIKSQEKHLVILRKTEIGYVIDYDTECDSTTLSLIQEVKMKGEDYFSFLLNQSVKSKNLQIYPNPFSDIIHINGMLAKRIEITDINGNIIMTELQNLNRIDLSSLKPGIYFVSIFSDNNKWTEKLVKN